MSDVIEICSIKVTIGNESVFVIGIYRPPYEAKLPHFDEILSNVLIRIGAEDCVFLVGDFDILLRTFVQLVHS